MEPTASTRASLGWKLALLLPMAVALGLLLMARQQTDLHAENRLTILGNLSVSAGITLQGLYWILARKSLAVGIPALMVGCIVLGFGLHTLLRAFGL